MMVTSPPTSAIKTAAVSAPKRSAHKKKLPSGFTPGDKSVICGRGKLCSASPGNKYLRSLIDENLKKYSMARKKTQKSEIVCNIIDRVREASPVGAFIKQEENGDWWEVDDCFAREKIGCIFRDILHKKYRSSTKAKQARKKVLDAVETASSNNEQMKRRRQVLDPVSCETIHQKVNHVIENPTRTGAWPDSQVQLPRYVAARRTLSFEPLTKERGEYSEHQTYQRAASPLAPIPLDAISLSSDGQLATKRQVEYGQRRYRVPVHRSYAPHSDECGYPVRFLPTDCYRQRNRVFLLNADSSVRTPSVSLLKDAIGVVDVEDLRVDCDDFQGNLSGIFDE